MSVLARLVRRTASTSTTRVLYPWTVAGAQRPLAKGADKNVVHMEDANGHDFDLYDFSSNLVSTMIDQRRLEPAMVAALKTGMAPLAPEFRNKHKDAVANILVEESPIADPSKARTWFGCTGSDAISTAVWHALTTTHKTGLLFMDNSFHGGEFYSSQVGTDPRGKFKTTDHMKLHRYPAVPRPICPEDFEPCLARTKAMLDEIGDQVGVFVVEGSNGSPLGIPWPKDYLPALVSLVRSYDIRVVMDEVMSGLKRAGAGLFAASKRDGGVVADYVCYGKALTNGMLPLSAVVVGDAEKYDEAAWGHGSTFSGYYMGLSTCHEMLNIVRSAEFDQQINNAERIVKSNLDRLVNSDSIVSAAHGSGIMWTIFMDLDNTESAIVRQELRDLFNIRIFGMENRIMVSPTADITQEHMDMFCNAMWALSTPERVQTSTLA